MRFASNRRAGSRQTAPATCREAKPVPEFRPDSVRAGGPSTQSPVYGCICSKNAFLDVYDIVSLDQIAGFRMNHLVLAILAQALQFDSVLAATFIDSAGA